MKTIVRTLAWLALVGAGSAVAAVEHVGRLTHEALSEVSGIVKSMQGNFYWVHNDSGDNPRIFAIAPDGVPLKPGWMPGNVEEWEGHAIAGAAHFDWEDIALADGVLYVADVGNNGNARRDLGVYVVNEPNPLAVPRMRALKHLPVRYPDQHGYPGDVWDFDCEGVFVADGRLHFLTKHRQSGRVNSASPGVKLYRLDTDHVDRENVLTLLGRRDDVTHATAADLSPDGRRLAVASYRALWIFDRPDEPNWLAGRAWHMGLDIQVTKQLEALAWEDADTLRLINEQRDIFRVKVANFEAWSKAAHAEATLKQAQ